MSDLLRAARSLAKANPKRPSQAFLRRSVSTAYYALFDRLARLCADAFIGRAAGTERAWTQAYRVLDHGPAKTGCIEAANPGSAMGFPPEITHFADAFVTLQALRHEADYNPVARFTRLQVNSAIQQAEDAITSLDRAPKRDQRAFAVQVVAKRRK